MAQSVFDIVKAPLGWSIFADNVKIGGIYGSKEAALEAAALAASTSAVFRYTLPLGMRLLLRWPADSLSWTLLPKKPTAKCLQQAHVCAQLSNDHRRQSGQATFRV